MECTANPIIAEGGRRGPASSEMATQLNALVNLDTAQLRAEWRRHYRSHPPKGLSRDLMIRAIAYKLQEVQSNLSISPEKKWCSRAHAWPTSM